MADLSEFQKSALQVAHNLIDMGVPLFVAAPNSNVPGEFHYPNAWQTWKPNHSVVERWRPGWALAMVCGVVYDVIDVDPRNGGLEGLRELADAGALPEEFGTVLTPSAGQHLYIARTHLAKGKPAQGIDLQAGDDKGEGRGFVFLPPTERPSKFGPRAGEMVPYTWHMEPRPIEGDSGPALRTLIDLCTTQRAPRRLAVTPSVSDPDDPFEGAVEAWTPESADRVISAQLLAVQRAKAGEVNSALGGAARVLGRFVAGGYLPEAEAVEQLNTHLAIGGVHSDSWNVANGRKWTADSVIAKGLENGAKEPWAVQEAPAAPEVPTEAPKASSAAPTLFVDNAAAMAYWLAQEIGTGRLAGFFRRAGKVVHTPRVGEMGYVEAGAGADNGPVEIQPVSGQELAAKVQFLYACYKTIKGKKDEPDRDVPAMFPDQAARRVVDAPEFLGGLRPLKGVTLTPMVRADGSMLQEPGYDAASGYLFLPSPGVEVPPVPEEPTESQRAQALALLMQMIEGFPFATAEDRANYLGLLLTPLLRELVPPPYKMFGISAHQPGSGKSLLAQVAQAIHGGVWRSEVPQEEAEWGKALMSILATTSAPLVTFDNVEKGGILRSSTLAGLLTTGGDMTERELGSNTRTITARNDRLWLVTGNNLSLGGDLVRRTITVLIDPDMANPETRSFAITDLPKWVEAHRNQLLWSLMVLVRSWVDAGRPAPERKQSDSFAAWETAVGGILAHAGVPGAFDAESGKKAAAGGDDDGLAQVLEHLHEQYGSAPWTVSQALDGDDGVFTSESRDWVPTPVLDKLARNEASGKKSMGHWLRNRVGRWVTTADGRALVIRDAGKDRMGAYWKIDER